MAFSRCSKKAKNGESVPLFVVNEAYSSRVGWCEGSIVMAENALHRHWKLSRPAWIAADVYEKFVLYSSTLNATSLL